MTENQREFLKNYYKACETSQPEDWFQAALSAKHMYNEMRKVEDEKEESKISSDFRNLYAGQ